jgi:MoxR-like ATPase
MALLIQSGVPCLIILDELNRPENERALNGVMAMLDWRATVKPVGAPTAVHLKPGQCVIATLNEGVEYVGTVVVDKAVRSRFTGSAIRMQYTPEVIETRILRQQVPGLDAEVAKRLTRIARDQRAKVAAGDEVAYPSGNVLDTRSMIAVARGIVVGGLSPKESLWAAIRSTFWPEDEKHLTALIEAQFGPDPVGEDTLADDEDIEKMLDGE